MLIISVRDNENDKWKKNAKTKEKMFVLEYFIINLS